jgi:hypothetical protein
MNKWIDYRDKIKLGQLGWEIQCSVLGSLKDNLNTSDLPGIFIRSNAYLTMSPMIEMGIFR